MASTASPSLKLELMATGDQSGTWGDTTNTNLGTLLEQAITGNISIAKVGTGDYTLTNTDYVSNENRNPVITFTGTPGGAFNVIVPNAKKSWVFRNSTPSAMTIKTAGAGTTVTIAASSSRWVYCDGSNNLLDVLTGTLATQSAAAVAITGGTITGLTSLTLASGAATPATNDAAALGTNSLGWSDLFLASGGIIDFGAGDVTITQSANALAFAGASSGYSVDAVFKPAANDGATLGAAGTAFSDLYLASGGFIDFANNDVRITHAANALAFTGASSGYTFDVPIGIASGGTGASLVDPNADRLLFWNDTAGQVTWLTAGTGLSITGNTIEATATAAAISQVVTNNVAGNTQTFNASGTWTKPNTGNYAIIYAWGGGGGADGGGNRVAGGSGGGFTAKIVALSSLGATETVTVGAGGSPSAANTAGATNFGTVVSAYGAGLSRSDGNQSVGTGGGGGSNSAGTGVSANNSNGLATAGGRGGGNYSSFQLSVPMQMYTMGQAQQTGFVPFYTSIEGRGADGGYATSNVLYGDGGDGGLAGGGSGGFTNNLSNFPVVGGRSVWGGGGGVAAPNSTAANTGQSVYGGRGGFGAANANLVGVQPGGGGGVNSNIVQAGAAGKVIVYVY